MDTFSQFGIDLFKFFIQLLFAFIFLGIPAIYATIAVIRSYHSGTAIILWLMLIWLFPIIGPVSAILSVRSARSRQAEQGAAANP
jgi:ABC-type transport system involved in multi-copper enzyme maturation permease subunit